MLCLHGTFYKTEISLLHVQLIGKRQISKLYKLQFSATKA